MGLLKKIKYIYLAYMGFLLGIVGPEQFKIVLTNSDEGFPHHIGLLTTFFPCFLAICKKKRKKAPPL